MFRKNKSRTIFFFRQKYPGQGNFFCTLCFKCIAIDRIVLQMKKKTGPKTSSCHIPSKANDRSLTNINVAGPSAIMSSRPIGCLLKDVNVILSKENRSFWLSNIEY